MFADSARSNGDCVSVAPQALERIGIALDTCKKALNDFLNSKRRMFPRYVGIRTARAWLLRVVRNVLPVKVLLYVRGGPARHSLKRIAAGADCAPRDEGAQGGMQWSIASLGG